MATKASSMARWKPSASNSGALDKFRSSVRLRAASFAPSMFFDEGLTAPHDHGYCFGPVVINPTSRGRVMRDADGKARSTL